MTASEQGTIHADCHDDCRRSPFTQRALHFAALFVMTLPYSDAIFIQAFPRECTEAFLEGHRRAFEFFGGVPTRISYDNPKKALDPFLDCIGRHDVVTTRARVRIVPTCLNLKPAASSTLLARFAVL